MQKVIFFGTGSDCKKVLEKYPEILSNIIAFVDNRCGEILAGIITVEKDLSCKTDYLIQQITVFKHTAYKLYSLKKGYNIITRRSRRIIIICRGRLWTNT